MSDYGYNIVVNNSDWTNSSTGGASFTFSSPTVVFDTPAETKGRVEFRKTETGIHPRLFFSFVKSKLNKLEKEKLKRRLDKLKSIAIDAEDMGQISLYEETVKMLAITARESEAVACGINKLIPKELVDKFISKVRDKTVKFERLEGFPRSIPAKIKTKIKTVQNKKLFDELWILYVDYTGEKLKSTKEKIREKDPILFGCYSYAPDRLYYICDWVDDYCDLTLDKFVEKIKTDDPEYELAVVPDIDETFLEDIKNQVMKKHERLKNTNRENYKQLMEQEEKEFKERMEKKRNSEKSEEPQVQPEVKRSFLDKVLRRKK